MPFFRASSAFDFLPIRGNWRLLTEQGTEQQKSSHKYIRVS